MSRALRFTLLAAALAWGASARAQTEPVPVGHDEAGDLVTCAVEPFEPGASRRAPSQGEVDVLIVRVRFAGDADAPPETDAAGVRDWYARASYGLLDLQITEAPVVDLSETRAHYAALGDTHFEGVWVDEAEALLAAAGTPPGDFDIVATLARQGAPFDLGDAVGRARLWGRDLWATSGSELVMVHEIGHTLGLNHARRREVYRGNPLSGDVREYGNPHDAMGNVSAGSFSVAAKVWMGWIDALPDVMDFMVSTEGEQTSATVRLRPTDTRSSPGAAGGLRIDLPEAYCLPPLRAELRADLDGVLIQEWRPITAVLVQSTLLDATPGTVADSTPGDGAYALLAGGEPLVLHEVSSCAGSSAAALSVRATGTDADGLWADLHVEIGADGGTEEETPNVGPVVFLNELPGGVERSVGDAVMLNITASDPDDATDADAVQVQVQVGDQWLDVPGPPYVTSWTPTAPGAYSIQARVTDSEGATATSRRRAVLVSDPAFEPRAVGWLGWESIYIGEWSRVDLNSLARPVVVAVFRYAHDFRDAPELRKSEGGFEVRASRRTGVDKRRVIVLAAEAGTHRLRDGSRLYAGTAEPGPGRWAWVPFQEPGDRTPGVFVSAVGAAEGDAPPRVRRVRPDGFEVWSEEGHLVQFVAMEPALLPSEIGAHRLETGVAEVAVGGSAIDVLQWFDPRPSFHIAAIQDAEEPEPPVIQITPATQNVHVTIGAAGRHAPVERSVAYLLSGRAAGIRPPTPILGTTLTPIPELPADPAPEFRVIIAPNPTRGAASVLVTLLEGGTVRATLVDVLGREVARLADGYLEAGPASFAIPRSLPAGSYLVRLRIGDAVRTERFTVAR